MQPVVNGVISGLLIALLAASFQIVYLSTKVFFIAVAGLYALAPYLFVSSLSASSTPTISIVISIAGIVALAACLEIFSHSFLARIPHSESRQVVSSLGAYIILTQAIVLQWGTAPGTLSLDHFSSHEFAGTILTPAQVTTALFSALLLVTYLLLLRSSGLGIRLRALADNPTLFATQGNNASLYRIAAFGISGALAAAASLLAANETGFDPFGGLNAFLLALVATIVGGRNSYEGPICGALLLGVVRAEAIWWLSPRWQDLVTFAALIVFIALRPRGLVSEAPRIEVADR